MDNIKLPEGNIQEGELLEDIKQYINGTSTNPNKKTKTASKDFPLNVLPPKLEEFTKGAEVAFGTPPAFLTTSCFLATSIAIGNAFQIEIKKGTTQKAIIYLVLIGNPNSNKSGALKLAIRPIQKRDGNHYEKYQIEIEVYEANLKKKKAEREELDKPIYRRSVISDFTPEALADALNENLRGMGIVVDELAGFFKNFNRYHQSGEQEVYLSIWSNSPIIIDRKISGHTRIEEPFVSIGGTIQPGVIEGIAKEGRGANGFIDRLLFSWPDDLEKPEWTEYELNQPLVEAYENAIKRLLDIKFSVQETQTIVLTKRAKKRLFEYYNKENKADCDKAENELLAGIYGKFDFHTARFALILHLLWWAYQGKEDNPPLEVEIETIERAIKVAEYFKGQALKVYNRLHNSSPIDRLQKDVREVYEALPESFQFKDGYQIAKNLFPNTGWKHEKRLRRLLNQEKPKLFEKLGHGKYGKLF